MLQECEQQHIDIYQLEKSLRYYYPVTLSKGQQDNVIDVSIFPSSSTAFSFETDVKDTELSMASFEKELAVLATKLLNVHNTSPSVVRFRRSIFGETKNWSRRVLSTDKLSELYSVSTQYDHNKDNVILSLSSRGHYSFFYHTAYLTRIKGQYQFCDVDSPGIRKMLRPEVPDIEVLRHVKEEIIVNSAKKSVTVPETGYGLWAKVDVLTHTPTEYTANIYTVADLGNTPKYTSIEVSFVWEGKSVKETRNVVDTPDWMYYIAEHNDKVCNPYNVVAHPYMGDDAQPLFEDDNYYVTAKRDLYVNHYGTWLEVSRGLRALEKNKERLSDSVRQWLERYELMNRLLE